MRNSSTPISTRFSTHSIAVVMALLVSLIALSASAQEKKEEDLKPYYFVLLKKGPNRNQDSLTAERIQKAHINNINKLAAAGKLIIAGPFLDDGDLRGIFIFDTKNESEVKRMVDNDPAVKAGRLVYEIHPWMTKKGSCFN